MVLGAHKIGSIGAASTFSSWADQQFEVMHKGCGPRKALGEGSIGDPLDSCLGQGRSPFIPLENELTSDGDPFESSWRHYLSRAKEASARADELGRQLLDQQLQQEMRREAALEGVANVCGDFAAFSNVTGFSNGEPVVNKGDLQLDTCLNEKKYDLVFLTALPPEPLDTSPAFLSTAIGCNAQYPSDLCKRLSTEGVQIVHNLDAAGPNTVSVGSLNLGPYKGPIDLPKSCLPIGQAAQAIMDGSSASYYQELVKVAKSDAVAPERVSEMLQSLKFVRNNYWGNWELKRGGTRMMSASPDSGRWPGCLRPSAGQVPCDTNTELYSLLFMEGATRTTSGDCNSNERKIPGSSTCVRMIADGNNLDGQTELAELGLLMWRVEGALWFMASMSGNIPEGLFAVAMPTVDFGRNGWTGTAMADRCAPEFTLSGSSVYELKSDGNYYNSEASSVSGYQTKEVQAQAFAGWPEGGITLPETAINGNEVPAWLAQIDGDSSRYLRRIQAVRGWGSWMPARTRIEVFDNYLKLVDGLLGLNCGKTSPINSSALPKFGGASLNDSAKQKEAWSELVAHKTPGGDYWKDGAGVVQSNLQGVTPFWATMMTGLFPSDEIGPESPRIPVAHLKSYDLHLAQADGIRTGIPTGKLSADFDILGGVRNRCASEDKLQLLNPNTTDPAQMAMMFVNMYPPRGTCGAYANLVQTLGLACNISNDPVVSALSPPPEVTTVDDIALLGAWYTAQSENVGVLTSRLHIEQVPARVVHDFEQKLVGTGTVSGQSGQTVLQLEQALQQIYQGWAQVGGNLTQVRDALKAAELQLVSIKIGEEQQEHQFAMQTLSIHQQEAQALASALASVGGIATNPAGTVGAAASAGIACYYGAQQMDELDQLKALAEKDTENKVAQALVSLNQSTSQIYTQLSTNFSSLISATGAAASQSSALKQLQSQAKYEIAKGMGEDYVRVEPGGELVDLPVNRSLNRNYEITQKRYHDALQSAKHLACVARLSIEQRLGAHLRSLKKPLDASLEAPAVWADDSMNVIGVDYDNAYCQPNQVYGCTVLNDTLDVGKRVRGQYIGDYVAKLEQFVDDFGIVYPFHEGDDTMVLSLSQDVLAKNAACVHPSHNLLYFSGNMAASEIVSSAGTETLHGWAHGGCSEASCVVVQTADYLQAPSTGPRGAAQDVSWLATASAPSGAGGAAGAGGSSGTAGTAGTGGQGGSSEPALDPTPPSTVYQNVHLAPGTYLLSWWAQSRDATGAAASQPTTYGVGVYDAAWGLKAGEGLTRQAATGNGEGGGGELSWGSRQQLIVSIAEDGEYRVAFLLGGQPAQTLALAGVQLEQVWSESATPSAYEHTSDTRNVIMSGVCKGAPADVRAAFEHVCESKDVCYYRLKTPLTISLLDGVAAANPSAIGSQLAKLAQGNINYRHVSLALNLVGTGVHDCNGAVGSDCYGSSYEKYRLRHDGHDVKVSNPVNGGEHFNFGTQSINDAKALAAEKYITLPVSGGDQGLLSQPEIEKTELRGRPLDGTYELSIRESPSLRWDRLEDVQLVIKYRYWSQGEHSKLRPCPHRRRIEP